MEEGHKYKFGQMPTRKAKIGDVVYRRLEIGEIIKEHDLIEVTSIKQPNIFNLNTTLFGQRYNPIREHKYIIIWRKDNALG